MEVTQVGQIKTKIILRNDVTANWELKNPVLSKGEAGIEFLTDGTAKLKLGDGLTNWLSLPYFGGTDVFGDDKSIQVVDGIVKLVGFDAAEVGAQPRKKADGTIEWVLPDTTTVEGLSAAIAGLQSDVTNLQTTVVTIQEIVNPSGEGSVSLLSRVETLEDKMDGDGEGSVNARIDAKINEFATKITDDGVVNSYKELIDYVAEHGGEATKMAASIASLQELVGTTPVSEQIATAISGLSMPDVVKGVKVNGTLLDLVDGIVEINLPVSSDAENKVAVLEDGTMEVNSLNVNKLTQNEGEWLVMNGGDAN